MAGSNRFESPIRSQYRSTYVPLPFDDILKAGAMKQQQFNQGADEISATQNMVKINADPGHINQRDALLQNYNNQVEQISQGYSETGDPKYLSQARDLQRQYANDPNRLQLESNYKNYEQYQKDVEDLSKKQEYDPIYDTYKNLPFSPDKIVPFNYTGTKSITNFYQPAHEMMASVAKSGSDHGAYSIDESGNIINKKSGWEAVARQDINRVAAAKVPLFLSHKDSQYFKDKFLSQNPNATQDDLNRAAYDYLRREGENQIFSKSNSDSKFDYAPSDIRDEKNNRVLTHTPTMVNPLQLEKLPEMEFDEKGNIKTSNTNWNYANNIIGLTGIPRQNMGPSPTEINQEKIKNEQLINKIKTAYPSLSNLTPKEVYEKYSSARNNFSQRSFEDINPTGEAKQALVEEIIGNKEQAGDLFNRAVNVEGGNRDMHVWDGSGGALDQMGYKTKEELMKNLDKTIKIQPLGPYAGSYVVTGRDADGKQRRLYIEPDSNTKLAFARTNVLSKEIEKMVNDPEYKSQPITINGITFTPEVPLDTKTNSFEPKIKATDPNGNTEYYKLDDIYKDDEDSYQQSNQIRTNLTTSNKKKI